MLVSLLLVLLASACHGFCSGCGRSGSSGRYGWSYGGSHHYGGGGRGYYSRRPTLAEAMATRPSNADPAETAGKDPLVPTKYSEAPPETLKIYWPGSRIHATTGAAIDTRYMLDRPTVTWAADPNALYTIISIDEGIPAVQPAGLQFFHWLVVNIPGDKVVAGDEFDEYVPPFSFKLDASGTMTVTDGSPLHAIMFLVYKQPGRIDFEGGQWGCNPKLGQRVNNKDALAEKYGLGKPVAGNLIYTKYSPEGTDFLFCKFTRCGANPLGPGPFPVPLAGVNDGPECQPSPSNDV